MSVFIVRACLTSTLLFSTSRCLASHPYCGIQAVHAAASAVLPHEVRPFEELVRRRFVSSLRGSTRADLMDAADHLGVHATPLDHRGVATLRAAKHPLLLHMMSDGQMESFNHWNCFLGFRDGQVLLMDGDGVIVPTDLPDVLMR